MLTKLGKLKRRLVKRFSRTQLLGSGLGLNAEAPESHEPGLIILQIDGLSREQFEVALAKKRLPFLRKLLRTGYFRPSSFYSGLPSTTPAVQAEVMYGIRGAVPAFQFLHRRTGQIFRMFEREAAETIAREQLAGGIPLLAGGVSYSNIYSGGSDAAEFCAETSSWRTVLQQIRPFRLILTVLLYSFTLMRIAGLAIIELLIALSDMFRGIITRGDWQNEARFVPSRVVTAIILREWVRIVVKLSISRGTPVIYANLLGYDEQSHRRGPSSAFAHWGLKGIDRVVKDIFKAARGSDARDYEVIVFSDHGHEKVRVYEQEFGRTIQAAVRESLQSGPLASRIVTSIDRALQRGAHIDHRMRSWLKVRRGRVVGETLTPEQMIEHVVVNAMGPLGHIYFPVPVTDETKAECAVRLVSDQHVPLVIYRTEQGVVYGRNSRGLWKMPEGCSAIFGSEHRFVREMEEDLQILCSNENSGDLIISGWDPEQHPITFVAENGSHGSIGYRETRGFVLLPFEITVDPRIAENGELYIRGVDLHDAALRYLHPDRKPATRPSRPAIPAAVQQSSAALRPERRPGVTRLQVMTYNTHHCIGMDGRCRPRRIASVIAESRASLVALQEMDDNRERTGFRNQTQEIAAQLGMYARFFSVLGNSSERYGLSLLSHFPMELMREEVLTAADPAARQEARGAIWVVLKTDSGPVHVINTHLGLRARERQQQIEILMGPNWLGSIRPDEPLIVCGDFNAGHRSRVMRSIRSRLSCVQSTARDYSPQATFASVLPIRRIDYILVSDHFSINSVRVIRNHATRVASDHLPVTADLTLHRSTAEDRAEHRSRRGTQDLPLISAAGATHRG